MDLGLAGALSGAGEAGTKALGLAQVQYGAMKMQEERDKMENLRLDKQNEFADRRAERDIAARGAEADKSRAHAEALQGGSFKHAEAMTDKQITAHADEGDKTRAHADTSQMRSMIHSSSESDKSIGSSEKIHAETNKVNKEIHSATNATQLTIAQIQRDMHDRQFDKTFTQAKLTALTGTVRSLNDEITRLSVVLSNPLADKTDPSYKAAAIQLDSATKMFNLYSQHIGSEAGIAKEDIQTTAPPVKKDLPAFKSPTSAAPPQPARRSGGMVQTPNTEGVVTDGMRKAVERLRAMEK